MPRPPADAPGEVRAADQRRCSGLAGLERLSAAWDALADDVQAMPFERPGWIAAWWRAFGRGKLKVLTSEGPGGLAAVLPVVRRPSSVFSPTNWHTPAFGLLGAGGAPQAEVADQLLALGAGHISLGFLPAGGTEVAVLAEAAEAARYRVRVTPYQRSLSVVLADDWDSFERGLRRNLRRDVWRCRRRLAEAGEVTLDVVDGGPDLDERLDEAFAVEHAGWKALRKTAIASRPSTTLFYGDVARWAAARGSLRLGFLRVGGRSIAFHLAIEEDGHYLPLKGGFDPLWSAYSPGKLLIHATLERAFALGLERYEFLGGADAYKRRWANDERATVRFQAFGRTPAGLVSRTTYEYGRPLAKRARGSLTRKARSRGPAS